ncbi:LPXTG cell wall anchor domain-containing protein [Streptomyces sp. NPDC006967]|uniref:LPXTG cell wall anchor domain-containing protein n=1 Tax=unclassified Streptomyces TaxID=2593676 RepID=UPI0015E1725F|nr:LPXTG cell wall anchor domain-containing protein [Streptomyces sp. SM1]
MSSALRPLLTATAAGTLLCALWFVPSANASSDTPAGDAPPATPSPQVTEQARVVTGTTSASLDTTGQDVRLADTGSFDSTPYVIGGTASLALGAGFVVYSVRRERLDF